MNQDHNADRPLPAWWRDWRFYLLILLALLLGALAYQVRLPAWVDLGTLGDRAYLWASPLQSDVGFNGDEHLAAEGIDYRWTKRVSWVRFPDIAWNGPLRVTVRVRGWRPEQQPTPVLLVRVNGALVGRFQASGEWETASFDVDEFPGHTADLEVSLECGPFNPGGADKRILGVQWDWVRVDPGPGGTFPVLPPWQQLLPWTGVVLLLYLALRRWLRGYAFWAGLGLAVLIALGLALMRNTLAPYNLWALDVAGALLLLTYADHGLRLLRQAGRRARQLPFYAALIGVSVVLLLRYAQWATTMVSVVSSRPDAILGAVFVITIVFYVLFTWDQRLRRLFAGLDRLLRGPWLSGALLVLLLAGVTLYEFGFIRAMAFVGHADYADNAVVARNLLAGRGFTVDYVTQFYNPNLALSHPQETWPLLQPVLIAPFFQLLGDSAFAAKVPNLLLQLALALVLYAVGTNLFDRRVGLLAVLLTVLNPFFFRLIIFPTSDLVFTLLAVLLVAQFFRAHALEEAGTPRWGAYAWAGVWAGLLMLAKVNGAFFVGACFLVDLFWRWRGRRWQGFWRAWAAFGLPAAALFSTWVVRNLVLFHTPIHSTEQFDAWVLKYSDWEDIYRVYDADLPNRSWLLRYGWDRVFEAVGLEFRRWWNYFAVDQAALMTLLGSALALGGALTLRRKAARLFAPVAVAFILFGAFICVYWHVEERYFVPFIPWLALLIARGLWWLHDTLAYRPGDGQRRTLSGLGWLGLVVVVVVCAQLVAPFPREVASKLETDQAKQLELRAYQWLAENTPADAVVMTRVPWQLTYYSGRRSVMIPQPGPQEGIAAYEEIVARYNVSYLLMDGDARGKRPELRQAVQTQGPWTLLYDKGGVQIYRLGEKVEARGDGGTR